MSKQDPNQKHYFNPIESAQSQVEHLKSFKKDQLFTLWEEGKSEKNVEEFAMLKFDAKEMVIYLKQNAGLLDKLTGSSLKNKTALFRTSFGNKKYFSKGPLTYSDQDSCYLLKVEPPIFMAQQRSDYRLEIDPKLINVKLVWDKTEFPVNDISAGGLSLKLEDDMASLLKDREYIQECLLIFKDLQVMIPSIQILKAWEQEEEAVTYFCFGMKFQGMGSKQEDRLAQKIAMEARGKEIRKIMEDKRNKKS